MTRGHWTTGRSPLAAHDSRDPETSAFAGLVQWYQSQCDGDWEHEYGVRLASLDNPGWTLEVDLQETDAEGRLMPKRRTDDEQGKWLVAWSDGERFRASCDPGSLEEMVRLFQGFIGRQD
ncbi:Imm53 family immunity protein [Streptomyces griseorubiginosus]|uniref:Imm53 family immunity protein n=1 Tax=Streptomyces griseorubiginosus TaxID=67304 RepID=UPI00362FAEF2